MTEALWLAKPKTFTTWPLTENVCQAWPSPLCPSLPSLPSCPLLNSPTGLFTVAQIHQAHWATQTTIVRALCSQGLLPERVAPQGHPSPSYFLWVSLQIPLYQRGLFWPPHVKQQPSVILVPLPALCVFLALV